jgi:hypothetical protein
VQQDAALVNVASDAVVPDVQWHAREVQLTVAIHAAAKVALLNVPAANAANIVQEKSALPSARDLIVGMCAKATIVRRDARETNVLPIVWATDAESIVPANHVHKGVKELVVLPIVWALNAERTALANHAHKGARRKIVVSFVERLTRIHPTNTLMNLWIRLWETAVRTVRVTTVHLVVTVCNVVQTALAFNAVQTALGPIVLQVAKAPTAASTVWGPSVVPGAQVPAALRIALVTVAAMQIRLAGKMSTSRATNTYLTGIAPRTRTQSTRTVCGMQHTSNVAINTMVCGMQQRNSGHLVSVLAPLLPPPTPPPPQ